jgi:hypothetical protein
MATIEERMKILKMIEDGKITAEEGAAAALSRCQRPGLARALALPNGSGCG